MEHRINSIITQLNVFCFKSYIVKVIEFDRLNVRSINPGYPFTRQRNKENVKQQMYQSLSQVQARGREEILHTYSKGLLVA